MAGKVRIGDTEYQVNPGAGKLSQINFQKNSFGFSLLQGVGAVQNTYSSNWIGTTVRNIVIRKVYFSGYAYDSGAGSVAVPFSQIGGVVSVLGGGNPVAIEPLYNVNLGFWTRQKYFWRSYQGYISENVYIPIPANVPLSVSMIAFGSFNVTTQVDFSCYFEYD